MTKDEIIEILEHFTEENKAMEAQQIALLSLLLKKGIISEEEYLESHIETLSSMSEIGSIP